MENKKTASNLSLKIAVIIPCYNEGLTIGGVVNEFATALPDAEIHVFDNASNDKTSEVARNSGAIVHFVATKGKGNVVHAMFADVEADIYVMVDGDQTYDAGVAEYAINKLWEEGLDLLNIGRIPEEPLGERRGHYFGNILFQKIMSKLFGSTPGDILSGYKILSHRFVKSFASISDGFEIETELMIHALEMRVPRAEINAKYRARPSGSESKLETYNDGWRILGFILKLYKHEYPLSFFSIIALFFAATSLGLGLPVVFDFLETGLVLKLPTALLSASLMLITFILISIGLILDTVSHGRKENKRLAYLACIAPGAKIKF